MGSTSLSATAPTITGLTYQKDLPGFSASNISFTDHSVKVGIGGIDWDGGQQLTINLQFVPEPSSLALIGVAVLALLVYQIRIRSAEGR